MKNLQYIQVFKETHAKLNKDVDTLLSVLPKGAEKNIFDLSTYIDYVTLKDDGMRKSKLYFEDPKRFNLDSTELILMIGNVSFKTSEDAESYPLEKKIQLLEYLFENMRKEDLIPILLRGYKVHFTEVLSEEYKEDLDTQFRQGYIQSTSTTYSIAQVAKILPTEEDKKLAFQYAVDGLI